MEKAKNSIKYLINDSDDRAVCDKQCFIGMLDEHFKRNFSASQRPFYSFWEQVTVSALEGLKNSSNHCMRKVRNILNIL